MAAFFIQQLNKTSFSLSPPCRYSLFVNFSEIHYEPSNRCFLICQTNVRTFFSIRLGYLHLTYYYIGTLLPTSSGSRSDISRDIPKFWQQMYRIISFPMSVVVLIMACISMIPKRNQSYLHSNIEKGLILFLLAGVYLLPVRMRYNDNITGSMYLIMN